MIIGHFEPSFHKGKVLPELATKGSISVFAFPVHGLWSDVIDSFPINRER